MDLKLFIPEDIESSTKYKTGNKVKVQDIINKEKCSHLIKFIGTEGFIRNYNVFGNGVVKYKVVVDYETMESYYFREEELELVI